MLMFGGDPHGNLEPIKKAATRLHPDAVILLGDMHLVRPLSEEMAAVDASGTRVLWIPGNHESDQYDWFARSFGGSPPSWLLHGRVVEVAGVRLAGLGGVFRQQVWLPRHGMNPRYPARADLLASTSRVNHWTPPWESEAGVSRRHRTSIWFEDCERLSRQSADILVTHEAPSSCEYGFRVIDNLALAMGARLIVHGHQHVDYDAVLRNGIRVMGVGEAGVRLEDGTVVAAGAAQASVRRVE